MNEKTSHWDDLASTLGAEVSPAPPPPTEAQSPPAPTSEQPVFEPRVEARLPAPQPPPKPRSAAKSDWGKLAANLGLTPELAVEPSGEAGAFLEEVPDHDADLADPFLATEPAIEQTSSRGFEGPLDPPTQTEMRADQEERQEGFGDRGRRRRRGRRGRGHRDDDHRQQQRDSPPDAEPSHEPFTTQERSDETLETPAREERPRGRERFERDDREEGRGRRGRRRRRRQPGERTPSVTQGTADEAGGDDIFADDLDLADDSADLGQPQLSGDRPDRDIDAQLGDDDDDEEGAAGLSHKNIPNWEEAIGIVIDANLTARSRSPQAASPQGHGRSGRPGRGGRGRGGHGSRRP